MVKSKLILAVAGAGKTYYLAELLKPEEKNILITFTNKNVENILKEIKNRYGHIPEETLVMTYAKFVYNWMIKPINPFLRIGDVTGKTIQGLDVYSLPEEQWKYGRPNSFYIAQNNSRHYLNKNNQLYINRMVKLFNKQNKTVKKRAFSRLEKYCDNLLIDEVQDFRTEDYKLLTELFALELPKTIGVGDYYQHSVSYTNQSLEKPFVNKKIEIPYKEYIENEETNSLVITDMLNYSRRAPESICAFIRDKLNINIYSKSKVKGNVILVNSKEELIDILNNPEITKIVYNNSISYTFSPVVNWTYSKGDTYTNTCVILTKTFQLLFEDHFTLKGINQPAINKLYVALTRAQNNVYIVKQDLFALIQNDYK